MSWFPPGQDTLALDSATNPKGAGPPPAGAFFFGTFWDLPGPEQMQPIGFAQPTERRIVLAGTSDLALDDRVS